MFPATKASSGLTIAFPDVCKAPATVAQGVPIPYPNIAKTATATKQTKTKVASKNVMTKASPMFRSRGGEAGTLSGVASAKLMAPPSAAIQSEIQGLKGMLNQLNTKMQGLQSKDPNEWQQVLQQYTVAASALYVTIHGS